MKKNSVVVFRVALGVAVWFLITKGFALWLEPRIFAGLPDALRLIFKQMLVPYTLGLAGFYLAAGKMEKKEPEGGQNVTAWLLLKSLLIQMGLSLPIAAVINILIVVLGGTISNPMAKEMFGANWIFYAVLLLLFNPVMEEILFRKLALDRLLVIGEKKAVLISSVLFALPHVISQGLPQMCATFVLALVWGNLRVKTGKLWPCIVLHGCFNLISGYIIQALTMIN
ncbi:CPBP family intramembrane glutamic endopeptidase [Butyrivibrio sp. MC2021]|uniref:CPBP family intramembrane glutamic endopeptidase n=1 Tax=Butyrivibrio sp. MC2021 TaxID=1408306 RepID=UPI00047C0257|nr:type II CAAX endopeptidase family protein [Butyrivibrio sp. MC2021]